MSDKNRNDKDTNMLFPFKKIDWSLVKSGINWIILKIMTILGALYLVAIPLDKVQNKFDQTDVVIFTLILLFSSGLIERLQELVVNKDGLTVKVNQLKAEQEKQKADIEANSGLIQRQVLAPLEQVTANGLLPDAGFLVKNLLNPYEWEHLKKLAIGVPFPYKKQYEFEVELRRLRTLDFIQTKPGKTIRGIPDEGDLRDYLEITERGRDYISLREGGISSSQLEAEQPIEHGSDVDK
ncbi:MAG TPA: hypothetical protein V6C90_06375 [Coleofasciculaceae cyanobacterium]|jgi:hypothetical protein